METAIVNACVAIGLSAACGFRVFLPLLIVGLMAATGHLALASNFGWLASSQAIAILSAAVFVEVLAYLIPVVDNLLDAIAAPVAVLAGVFVTAAVLTDANPVFRWSLAVIAGGGAAGSVKLMTTMLRGASTVTTGGVANPVLSILELVTSAVMAVLAIFLPLLVMAGILVGVFIGGRKIYRRLIARPPAAVS